MKILWLFIRGMLKIGVIAGLFLAALVLAIWGLQRSGLIAFRAGLEQDRTISLAKDSEAASRTATDRDDATDLRGPDDGSTDRDAEAALRRLTEQARAAQAEAEHEYKRLRSRVNAIINARPTPGTPGNEPRRDPPEKVSSPNAEEHTEPAPEAAPDYRGIKGRLESLSSGSQTAPQNTPSVRPTTKPIERVDAPQYQDLKQRLANILGTKQ